MRGLRSGAAKFKRDGNEPPHLSIQQLQQQPLQSTCIDTAHAFATKVTPIERSYGPKDNRCKKPQLADLDQRFGTGWLK